MNQGWSQIENYQKYLHNNTSCGTVVLKLFFFLTVLKKWTITDYHYIANSNTYKQNNIAEILL